METDPQHVPSVVSVMVVHEPGDWFEEALEALAAQDYPNLRTLFLLTATTDDDTAETAARIRAVLPSAFVRPLGGNPGFGAAVNEVLRLVEGDNGFFLLCHDDIAPEPSAVRALVAEIFRSNAGIVGPKLVEWDRPRVLQAVGLGLDRFGEVDTYVEPGEVDQEQHDAVRDVFVLPSACLLVRADLFRVLDGYDPAISFHGDDVDLCWRAHLTGARVIVAPDARVRHRQQLVERRPDLPHRALRSRHRMRALAVLTGASRLLGRSIQVVLLTLVELVAGLFTGRFGEALSSLRALVGLVPRTLAIVRRRGAIRRQRIVPEREILGLQDAGSSRLTSYLRGRETTTLVGAESTVRRWREASYGPILAWFLVVAAVLVGSRSFIRGEVPAVGEFLPFPASPSDLWDAYRTSFDGRGLGATAPVPTGWALLVVGSVTTLFRMELLLTASIVGMYLVGALGAWRLATVFPVNRARIAGMVVYVGTPLVPGLLRSGDWSALAWYATLPWLVHLVRQAAGLAAADPAAAAYDLTDGVADVGWRDRLRAFAALTLVLAATVAFVPVVVVLWPAVGLLLALATVAAAGSIRVALWIAGSSLGSAVLALALNLPWAFEWTWDDLVGAPLAGSSGRSLVEIASLSVTSGGFVTLAVALYLPILAALAITRAWRLTWSVRAGVLVVSFGALLVFAERGDIGVELPRSSLLAVPIALGLALGAAAIAGGFGSDVVARGFGWRQPVTLLANAAIVVGLVPAVLTIGNGAWNTPRTPMAELLAAQLPVDPAVGDYRVLYVGDPRLLPVPGRSYDDGIAYAVADAGPLDFTERFAVPVTTGDDAVEQALDLIASGSTLRAGRVLAPLGIRFIVVPQADGVVSTVDEPIPAPEGLVAALQNQLDIGTVPGQPSLEVFVNEAWFPVGAQLIGATAEASRLAGEEALVRADLSEAIVSMVGADGSPPAGINEVTTGVLHVGVPFDERLTLDVDGVAVSPRPGFGVTTAYDVEQPGTGVLGYEPVGARDWWITGQLVLWLVVVVVAIGARSPFGRRPAPTRVDETLIDLGDEPIDRPGVVGEVLGLAPWPDDDLVLAGEPDEVVAGAVPVGDAADRSDDEASTAVPVPDEVRVPATDTPPVVGRSAELADTPAAGIPTVGPRAAAPAADDDDEVDLAALVADVDRRARDAASDPGAVDPSDDPGTGRGEDQS